MNEVTIFFGATEQEKDLAMMAYAAGRQPATWHEANVWRQVGLIDANPFPDPAAGMFSSRKVSIKSARPAKPSFWRRLIFAE